MQFNQSKNSQSNECAFNHASRYEWLEQSKNPITFVRQSAERLSTPEVLEPAEIQRLLSRLGSPYRLMALLAVTTGLRRSELFALKWGDVDITSCTLHVKRSIYNRIIGRCKTLTSKKDLPLAPYVITELVYWRQKSNYQEAHDWVFASPRIARAVSLPAGNAAHQDYQAGGDSRRD